MKQINLSVDEKTLDRAETFALSKKTSVTDLLLDYLNQVALAPVNRDAARARLIELSKAARGEVGTRDWTRDDLYAR